MVSLSLIIAIKHPLDIRLDIVRVGDPRGVSLLNKSRVGVRSYS